MPLELIVDFTHGINYPLSETSHFPPVIRGFMISSQLFGKKVGFPFDRK